MWFCYISRQYYLGKIWIKEKVSYERYRSKRSPKWASHRTKCSKHRKFGCSRFDWYFTRFDRMEYDRVSRKKIMRTPLIRYGAKRSLRTKSSLIPLKELKNGKRNNSQSQSSNPHPNPIENIKCSFMIISLITINI